MAAAAAVFAAPELPPLRLRGLALAPDLHCFPLTLLASRQEPRALGALTFGHGCTICGVGLLANGLLCGAGRLPSGNVQASAHVLFCLQLGRRRRDALHVVPPAMPSGPLPTLQSCVRNTRCLLPS